jgi:hypothetical protein
VRCSPGWSWPCRKRLHALVYKRREVAFVPALPALCMLPLPKDISPQRAYTDSSLWYPFASVPEQSLFQYSYTRPQHNVNTMILPRANEALQINPPAGQQRLSVGGSDWLWAVTAVFILEFVGLYCFDLSRRLEADVHHSLPSSA